MIGNETACHDRSLGSCTISDFKKNRQLGKKVMSLSRREPIRHITHKITWMLWVRLLEPAHFGA